MARVCAGNATRTTCSTATSPAAVDTQARGAGGGSPSARDRILASRLGAHAVRLLKEDRGGLAVGVRADALIEVPLDSVQVGDRRQNEDLERLIDVMAVMTR